MKGKLVTALCCLYLSLGLYAQDSLKVNTRQIELADIVDVLEVMHVKIFNFDLTSFLTDTYSVKVYVEEHEKGKDPKLQQLQMGKNKELLENMPEDFKKYKNLPDDAVAWDKIKKLSLFLTSRNDSTTQLTIKIPDVTTRRTVLKLHAIGKEKIYFYEARPYLLKSSPNTDKISIPLILYGSGWVDEKYGVMRFCGENEIDADNKEGVLLPHIPHYYIVGIEVEKTKG